MPFPFLPIRTAHPEGIVLVQASTGKVMLYGDNVATSDGFYDDCCCAAPDECPCSTVYPERTWPCNGLVQNYEITNALVSPFDGAIVLSHFNNTTTGTWYEYRMVGGSGEVTARDDVAVTCVWRDGFVEYRDNWNQTWLEKSIELNYAYMNLGTNPSQWQIIVPGGLAATKGTRNIPVGSFSGDRTVGNVRYRGAATVAEAAP